MVLDCSGHTMAMGFLGGWGDFILMGSKIEVLQYSLQFRYLFFANHNYNCFEIVNVYIFLTMFAYNNAR